MPETMIRLSRVEMTSPMMREVNRGLAVRWINAALETRAGLDITRDIMLYDEDTMLMGILPIILGPELPQGVHEVLHDAGVRSYSIGIV